MQHLNVVEVAARLAVSVLLSGIIGSDREFKSRPAGIRTHILVCVGSTVIALIQQQIVAEALRIAVAWPDLAGIVRSDPSRLIAQVVSGIGFLGAGTIVITKRSVMGLTTAASLWAMAGLGLAVGMGYYEIAAAGFLTIIIVLVVMKKMIHVPALKRLEIQYQNPKETKAFISNYFRENEIIIKSIDYDVEFSREKHAYTNIYTLTIPKNMDQAEIIEDLAACQEISRIRVISV